MTIEQLKKDAKFTIKVMAECKKTYGSYYLQKLYASYFLSIDGTYINCIKYTKHDSFFINFADNLERELQTSHTGNDINLIKSLKAFNDCEDAEDYDISTWVNFIGITTASCTGLYTAARYLYETADAYIFPMCVLYLGYEFYHHAQTLCPDQLRTDLIGNLTSWSEI